MGFARIEKVRLDHSDPSRGSATTVVPASRSCAPRPLAGSTTLTTSTGEGSAKGPERNRSAVEHQRTGSSPGSTESGPRARPFGAADRRAPCRGRSLEDRGNDLIRGNGEHHEQQRPALRHIDLQRLPAEGVATEKSLVEFHEHEPERPRQRDRVDETGAETGSDRGGGGDRERSLTWPNLWRTALPWPRERLPDRRLVRRDRRSGCKRLGSGGVALTVEQVVEGDPVIRWQLRLGPDGVELDRDPSTDPDIRITTDRETATEIRAGTSLPNAPFSEGNSGSAATSRH